MAGIIFIDISQIIDGATLHFHSLVSHYRSITFLNPVAI